MVGHLPSNGAPTRVTPSTSTRNCESSRVRRGQRLGRGAQRRIVLEQARVLGLDHPGAGARRHHHVLGALEELDRAARRRAAASCVVAGVEQRHAAAGLARPGNSTVDAERAQQPHDRHADLGEEHVAQAGDHERDANRGGTGLARGSALMWAGGGVTSTSTSRSAEPSLTRPCSTPAGRDQRVARLEPLLRSRRP